MSIDRRQFLARSAAVTAGATLAGIFAEAGPAGAFPIGGYGPLVTDPAGIVDLPAGFTYKVLASSNTIVTPGALPDIAATQLGLRSPAENLGAVPGAQDGMGSVYDPATKRTYLVCNHELTTSSTPVPTTFRDAPVFTHDGGTDADGGCTVLVLDEFMEVIEHFPIIAGTIRNCAGGMTPWGTWITCEENTSGASGTARLQNHGYLFEMDPRTGQVAGPYSAMGRANHEAVSIDPTTSDAYITEDATGSVVYKFVPTDTSKQFGSLGNGGSLFAMKVPGKANFGDFGTVGETVTGVTWTPCPGSPDIAGLAASFPSADVTRGNKVEGCWWIEGAFWFVSSYSTAGAYPHNGQVFKYDPTTSAITLIARIPQGGANVTLTDGVTTQTHLLRDPDNLAATPYGGAIWSQDGGSAQYLACVEADGSYFPLAKNPAGGEWAGAHFSADGKWLFANQQTRGLTLAITGPWVAEPGTPVPEVPTAVLAPLTGAAAVAAMLAWRSRRMSETVG